MVLSDTGDVHPGALHDQRLNDPKLGFLSQSRLSFNRTKGDPKQET